MTFDIATLSPETITTLAKAIARAQLTASDDWAEEIAATFPTTFGKKIPAEGSATGPERLKKARELAPEAARHAQEKEAQAAVMEKLKTDRAAREAEFAEKEALRFKADQGRFVHESYLAKENGHPLPQAPRPVRTLAEVERENARQHLTF